MKALSLALVALLFLGKPLQAAPTTNADAYTGAEDQALNVDDTSGVLSNDSAPGDLTAILESDVSNGTLTLNSDGSFTYTPNPNFHGTDSFTYRASETPGAQIFTVDPNQSAAVIDATLTNSTLGSDSDSTSARLFGTVEAVTTPLSAPFSEIQVTDLQIAIADDVELNFRYFFGAAGVNVTAAAGDISIEMVTPGAPSAVDASGNFSQPQNEVRAFGTVEAVGTGLASGAVPAGPQNFDDSGFFIDLAGTITQAGNTLTLNSPFVFVGTFQLDADNSVELDLDGNIVATSPVQTPELSAPTTVTITVNPVNDSPLVQNESYSTATGATLTIPAAGVLANDSDIDGDPLTATVQDPPTNGSLTLAPDGSFIYTPAFGFAGTDSFTYEVQDIDDFIARALIPFGDDWKFLDDGSNQGTAWRSSAFDDSAWPSGPGELGYGEAAGDQATEVSFGGDANNKFATTYFRNHFFIGNTAELSDDILIQLVRDDAAAVYINGVEIYRDTNLVSGAAFNTFANPGVADENEIVTVTVPLTTLVNGRNTIAVEVHQASGTSTDLAFHLALTSEAPAESPIVPLGSVWKYEDAGNDLGTTWTNAAFDDALWASGPGDLGYGDGDEVTALVTPANPKPLTVYFRHSFILPDASQVHTLAIDLIRDDGIAVYLNGTEIVRDNLAPSAAFDTPAENSVAGDSETELRPFVKIDPTLLVDGENIITAEVHQINETSSDLSFDLQIRASMTKSLGLATIDVIGIPFIDTDNDGMDDNWETANGLTVGADDSILDADGDGQNNLAEFIALTNPQDPASLLKIVGITQAANSELTVDFTSTPGKSYQLQYSPDLTSFSDVAGATLTATANQSSFTTISPNIARGYLRVLVQ